MHCSYECVSECVCVCGGGGEEKMHYNKYTDKFKNMLHNLSTNGGSLKFQLPHKPQGY